MRQRRDSIEERLAAVADDAAPPSFTAAELIARVKRRRRLTAWTWAAATAVVVLSVVAVAFQMIPKPIRRDFARDAAPGPATPSVAPPGPTASPEGTLAPYVCGEPFRPGNGLPTRNGLSLSISSMRKVTDRAGPDMEVTLSANRQLQLVSTPPTSIEVLYLKDGVIVGGGPRLNTPGDHTPQASDLIRYVVDLGPGRASVQKLGPRDQLCPSLRWSEVWALPGQYEVVVLLHQPVEVTDAQPPSARVELLIARSVLHG
jgi:hypothetical protein